MGSEGLFNIILLTGSNLGLRELNLALAMEEISKRIGSVQKISSIYESAPWSNADQAAFLNQAISVFTRLTPEKLLEVIHLIESKMGRVRKYKWEARIIDIDILFYGNRCIRQPALHIPHVDFNKRSFAIVPVMEIAPDFIHPGNGMSIKEIRKLCTDPSIITKITRHVS